ELRICSAADLAPGTTADLSRAASHRARLAANGSAAHPVAITEVLTPAADFSIGEAGIAIVDADAIFATEPPSVTPAASTPIVIRPAEAHGGVAAAVVIVIIGIGGVVVVVVVRVATPRVGAIPRCNAHRARACAAGAGRGRIGAIAPIVVAPGGSSKADTHTRSVVSGVTVPTIAEPDADREALGGRGGCTGGERQCGESGQDDFSIHAVLP